ncbi:TPA: hypothetical protein RUT48_000401 [Escherichia coli]|nr:hypothetical protein [Escherichia coli]HBB0411642.1 hypothetical protein [Escherichia coli]HBB0472637.1 hypothetical protein [Escherichia coli]HDS2542921.1 hypothetical protein [Escherichia coli]HDT0023977.1 hypothetical protein [Escherichia coli]
MSLPFLRTLQGDRFFQLLILVGIGLSFFVPFAPKSWPAAIDWHTIITLSGLMLLTKGVELSGYFDVLARRVVLSVDWTLLLVFMAMFIDVHLLTQLPVLQGVLSNVSHLSEPGLWLTAIGLSQVISNVPSTILLLNYVPPSLLLAWAVNVGGFGLLPGSLANLIALRMANDRRIWWRFHLYSIPMLLWAALVGYVLLVMIPAG